MFQKLGLVEPYDTKDTGREKLTQNEADRFVFKVPSLRNVEKTGPWFHDGSVTSLDDAIRLMARHQLGRQLTDPQIASIRSFLEALTGTLDTAFVAKPELPPDAHGRNRELRGPPVAITWRPSGGPPCLALSEAAVLDALRPIIDPDFGKSIAISAS